MRQIAVTRVDGRWHDLPDVGVMVSGDVPQGLCPACLMAVAATPDGSGRPNVTSSLGSSRFLSERVETVAQFLEDRAHRSELGPVVDLAWIVALIEKLLAPIAVVANVDEAAFGQ